MTKLQRECANAVTAWCEGQGRNWRLTSRPRHVHPRAYVVGYAAPLAIVVAQPWMDSEPQVRDYTRRNPLTIVRNFDRSLKAGDWCITAYVCRDGSQETVAIPQVAS
jgi:hypothetical protein